MSIQAATFFVLSVVLLSTPLAQGSPPGQEPPASRGEYLPRAGYARSAIRGHLARRARERGLAAFVPGQQLSISGTRALPVICVNFENVDGPFPVADYQKLLFDPGSPDTMTAYYRDISLGRLNVTGRVVGWYNAPKKDTYYENGQNGDGVPFGEFLTFGLKHADAELDFGQFDNDGRDGVANSGDDDGIVDTVFFIHPESGAECDGGTNIWSHSWHYSEPTYGHSGPFVTNDNRLDRNGQPRVLPNGEPERIRIEDYTIQPALDCGSTASAKVIVPIGVFCHEYGHALGVPDLYDRTPRPAADSHGVGNWCLMAGGSYGGDGAHADRPTHMSAWIKYYLGWANPLVVNADKDLDLSPVYVGNDMIRLVVPGTNGLEYFLIEHRQSGNLVPMRTNWDEFLPNSGLAVWHIDERVGQASPRWPFADLDGGQNDSPVRVNLVPPPIFKSAHPLVALLQSDTQMHLENSAFGNRGDAGDLFRSGQLADDGSGKAGTRGYDGKATNIQIDNIAVTVNSVAGKIKFPSPGMPPAAPEVLSAPEAPPPVVTVPAVTRDLVEGIQHQTLQEVAYGDQDVVRLAESLEPAKADALRTLSLPVLKQAASPGRAAVLYELAGELRTEQVLRDAPAESDAGKAVQVLLKDSPASASVEIGFESDAQRVAFIKGLRLAPVAPTPADDAQQRLAGGNAVRTALSFDQQMFNRVTIDTTDRVQNFMQTVRVGEQNLPVWNTSVQLIYNTNDELTGVRSQTVRNLATPAQIEEQTAEKAIDIVTKALGIPEGKLENVKIGVFVREADEPSAQATGRIAYRVQVPVEAHEPIDVFVDSETLQILDVQ